MFRILHESMWRWGQTEVQCIVRGIKIMALASYQNQFQQGDTRILAFWIIYGTVAVFMLFVLLFTFFIIVVTRKRRLSSLG